MFGFQPIPSGRDGTGILPPPGCSPNAAGVPTVTSGTSHVVTLPASMPAGQTIIIAICRQGAGFPSLTPPAGYSTRHVVSPSLGGTSANGVINIYYKTSTGSEPTTVTFTTSSSTGMVSIASCVSCAFDASKNSGTGNASTITMPTPTPSVGGNILQMAILGWITDGSTISSFSSGYTIGYASATTGSGSTDVGLAIGFKQVIGGSAAPGNVTMSTAVDYAATTEVIV